MNESMRALHAPNAVRDIDMISKCTVALSWLVLWHMTSPDQLETLPVRS